MLLHAPAATLGVWGGMASLTGRIVGYIKGSGRGANSRRGTLEMVVVEGPAAAPAFFIIRRIG